MRYPRQCSRGDGRAEDSGQKSPGLQSLTRYRKRSCPLPSRAAPHPPLSSFRKRRDNGIRRVKFPVSPSFCFGPSVQKPRETGKFSLSISCGGENGPNSFLRHHNTYRQALVDKLTGMKTPESRRGPWQQPVSARARPRPARLPGPSRRHPPPPSELCWMTSFSLPARSTGGLEKRKSV